MYISMKIKENIYLVRYDFSVFYGKNGHLHNNYIEKRLYLNTPIYGEWYWKSAMYIDVHLHVHCTLLQ